MPIKSSKIIMLDIETLSTTNNAAILSIGAVCGDLATGRVIAKFYQNINLDSCLQASLVTDERTIKWWEGQPEPVRKALEDNQRDIKPTCISFLDWCKGPGMEGKTLWAKGPEFDNVILRNAFDAVGVKFPFVFWASRDVRTMLHIDKYDSIKKVKRRGDLHNALSDALFQFECCSAVWRGL